ncbi:MAG TPA: DUF2550 family protein [Ornithinimicrobium sp.]|uniref:DUF2550 family protein n=1 Tax=Ornithinimicrobium sp. TaxID=1977084 RepID=UPI002B47DD4F|nr:DUF2550 family protein [Ornithinimicrobium sp.]HKJ12477.1 DUF2550 family protein [Ornithinimicrobium sp.]
MSSVLLYVVAIGVAVLLLLGTWGWTAVSSTGTRRSGARRFPAGLRAEDHDRWTMGMLVYQDDRLLYRRPGPLGRSRALRWDRFDLEVGIGSWIDGQDISQRLRGVEMVTVPCRYGEQTFELAVSPARYTALRSWVEAGPPGWNAGVA